VLIVVDLLVAPHPRRYPIVRTLLVLVFPVLWLTYTFVRGPLVPDEIARTPYWYPYGFLDPHVAGWQPVVTLVAVLMVFAYLLGLGAVLVWRLQDRYAAARSTGRRRETVPAGPA